VFIVLSPSAGASDKSVKLFNAEDLAPLENGKWVIVSSMSGGMQAKGGLFVIDAKSGATRKLYPADKYTGTARLDGCPTEVAADAFAPHGITLQEDARGVKRLYVVNHGGRESIEIFEVKQGTTINLQWIGCLVAPSGVYGNSVAVSADGTVFMTNMHKPIDGSTPISRWGGDVATWSSASGWRSVPGSAIVAPNGLLLSPDGRELYVASWVQGEVVAFTLGEGMPRRRVLKLSFLPDNLRWGRSGNIIAAGHRATVPAVSACIMAAGRCPEHIQSAIAEIDSKSLTTRCVQSVELGLATVAVNVGAEIWIGAARGDSILRLPKGNLAAPNCERQQATHGAEAGNRVQDMARRSLAMDRECSAGDIRCPRRRALRAVERGVNVRQ